VHDESQHCGSVSSDGGYGGQALIVRRSGPSLICVNRRPDDRLKCD
jgi:hypothetical protein